MTVAALVECNLTRNALGLPSRCLEDLGGRPALARTLDRLARCPALDVIAVLAPVDQHPALNAALREGGKGTGYPDVKVPGPFSASTRLFDRPAGEEPRLSLLRRARKWSLAGWCGGLFGATVFDEIGHPGLLRAAETLGAQTVVVVPPDWPWIDPALLAEVIGHHQRYGVPFGFTFTQAPPGLVPAVYERGCLAAWAERGAVLGDILRYHPDAPRIEFVTDPCCFQVPGTLLDCEERLTADTARGLALGRSLIEALGPDAAADAVVRFVTGRPDLWPGPAPREVVLELTAKRPVEDALRPLPGSGFRVQGSGKIPNPESGVRMPPEAALKLVREIAKDDDTLLTLGGRGDPLAYPHLGEVLHAAQGAGIFGINLVTYGHGLTEAVAEALVAAGVDAVTFLLDAHTPFLYAETKGGASLEVVLAGMQRLKAAREARGALWPIPVVEFVKTRRTLPEMEAFYDEWLRRGAWPVIRGPTDLAGQVEDLSVVSMAPPRRTACRRIFRRLTVLADGRVPSCDEDVACQQPLGSAVDEGLSGVWDGRALAALRRAHINGRLEACPLCGRCREWHRP